MINNKIDFVIPWVDSNDKKWLLKKRKVSSNMGRKMTDSDADERFRDYGTLKYLFRSIQKYASWVNNIYLVTDEQVPNWINLSNKKLNIIDHSEIIDKEYLPTFNSNVIEMNTYKIEGLSENFVELNDDILFNSPTTELDFFKDNLPCDSRLYRSLAPKEEFDYIPFTSLLLINKFINGKWPLNKKGIFFIGYGKEQFHNVAQLHRKWITGYNDLHTAYSFKKSTFYNIESIWPNELAENNKHHFRNEKDISPWLARYLQLETGRFTPRTTKFSKFYTLNDIEKIKIDLNENRHKLLCINDSKVDNYDKKRKILIEMLEKKYAFKSDFEL